MPAWLKWATAPLLLAFAAAPTIAGDGSAPMYSSPDVKVDGGPALIHEILPGQLIEIPPNNSVILHPGGDEVFLSPLSSAVYGAHRIELKNGTTSVTTHSGLVLGVHQYTVTPIGMSSKFEVSWNTSGGRVRVYDGAVRVTGCEKRLDVPKDQIVELGRDCKVGAYLRPENSIWTAGTIAASIAAPATPIICYYTCLFVESYDGRTNVPAARDQLKP